MFFLIKTNKVNKVNKSYLSSFLKKATMNEKIKIVSNTKQIIMNFLINNKKEVKTN